MIRFAVAVPVMNQPEITQKFLDQFNATASQNRPMLLVIDNGSTPPVRDWLLGLMEGDFVIRNEDNVGVMPALNQAYTFLRQQGFDYIFYTHNDVMLHEKDWDEKIRRIIDWENTKYPDKPVGVAGFYGAKGIGAYGIYQAPYQQQQMIRIQNVSNCTRMDPVHGYRPILEGEVEEVAVMDGFSLIVSVDLLNKTDGFDRLYPVHHMYDNDICLEAWDKGYRNIVMAMDAYHLGGKTDVGENWAEPFGKTKQEIHTEAHPVFYEKWHPRNVESGRHKVTLPFRVP